MAIQNLLLPLLSTPTTTDYYTQYAGETSDVRNFLATQGDNLLSSFTQDETITVFNNGLLRINVTAGWYGNHAELNNIEVKNLQTNKGITINNPNIGYNLYLCLGYDDSVRTAYYFLVGRFYYNKAWNQQDYGTFSNNREDLYLAISGSQPVQYTWQSVPSISGKNGILSLVTLDSEAINDGEPVSGAAVSVFDQAPSADNNVKDLADTYGSGEESSAVDVTVKYKVTLPPGGAFSVLKLVAKKDSIPEDATDGDKIVDISPTKTKKTVTGLDENSMYYFKIFAEDSNSNTSESDEKHILTSGDEGYNFDYTGEIVEWTVPKTGVYSLETWGAQGGNATDGTNSARGGYGAYAYGEVLLTQGEKLYINVGGQNGYGGGGKIFKTLLDTTSYDDSIASNKWGQSHTFGAWEDYYTPGQIDCNYDNVSNYIGFNTYSPSQSRTHNILALIQAIDFSEYTTLTMTVELGTQCYQWGYCNFYLTFTDTLFDHDTMGNRPYHSAIVSHAVSSSSNTGSSSKTVTIEVNLANYRETPQYIYLMSENMNKLKITNIKLIK